MKALVVLLLALAVVGCSDKRPTTPLTPTHLRLPPSGKGGKLRGPPGLPSKVIAELAGADADVRFLRNGPVGMLVARRNNRWLAGPVMTTTKGSAVKAKDAKAGLRDIASAPADATPTALAAFGDGFALAWVQPAQAGDELWAVAIAPDGQRRGQPRKLTRTFEPIHWVELLEGGGHVVAVWEVKKHDDSDLLAATWKGERVSDPLVVAKDIGGWHGAANRDGALFAWVTNTDKGGQVHARAISSGGLGADLKLTTQPTALADVQVAALDRSYAVAWTDTGASDPNVYLALVGEKGVIAAARPALDPVGGQALVSLVASSDKRRALLAWEHEGQGAGTRSITLGILDGQGKIGRDRGIIDINSSDAPHIVNDGQGFAALTLAPMRMDGAPTGKEPVVPMFVRFDGKLAVRAGEPVRVDALARKGGVVAGVPRSVRSLECDGGVCTVVARGDGKPALMMLVNLPVRAAPWQKAARRLPDAGPPLPVALDALSDLEQPLADMSAARLADGRALLAWVTHAEGGGTLAFRFVEADGRVGAVQTLSKKALSVGGLEVIPLSGKPRGVALIAWASSDGQVLLTAINDNGKSERQKAVTKVARRGKGPMELFDVAVASDGSDGFICAWTDTRDGDHEIYAARVDAELEKRKGDQRVTQKPGPSTEVSIRVVGDRAFLLWSDSESATEPRADIYIAGIDRLSLETVVPARRLEATEAHSRTPRWAIGAPTAVWIEEPLEENAQARGEVRLIAVSDRGEPLTAARRVRLPSGSPATSASIGCDATRCRGVLAAAVGNALELGAFSAPRESGAPVRAQPLTTLSGGTAQDLLLTTADSALEQVFFTQDAGRTGSNARLRRLRIKW